MDTRPTADGHDRERERLSAALPAYDIGAVLGRGAFAVVYAGRHRHLEREVAIKRLAPELLRETGGRDRFGAEARVLASLDHPHIVRVYDYVDREDLCAFVMERMHGGTLGDRLRSGRVSYAWACAVILAALQGLEHAHRKGVLHRDVKPENLLFGADDVVKVGDFGIAKVVGAQGARLAATTAAIGTPTYMAPEQVSRSAGPLGPATDVWAAGAVLYEMLAGEPPFALDGDIGEILLERPEAGAVACTPAGRDGGAAAADPLRRLLQAEADHVAVADPARRAHRHHSAGAVLRHRWLRGGGHGRSAQASRRQGRVLCQRRRVGRLPHRQGRLPAGGARQAVRGIPERALAGHPSDRSARADPARSHRRLQREGL